MPVSSADETFLALLSRRRNVLIARTLKQVRQGTLSPEVALAAWHGLAEIEGVASEIRRVESAAIRELETKPEIGAAS